MTDKTIKPPFSVIEPWDSPVNGATLANDITSLLTKYMYLPDGAAEVITMWILHTYDVNMFDFTPRLCVLSPEKRCGKTTLLALIESLSYNVINTSGLTPAVMFRGIDAWHPTLLIDEADTFLNVNKELRGVLNAGFKRDGKIYRVEGDKERKVVSFDCYAPIAIAAIGRIPDTITDRGIIITMRRCKGDTVFPKMRTREVAPLTHELQRKCLRFITDNSDKISAIRPEIPDEFNSRAADIWEPLYAIAAMISPEWASKVRNASLKLLQQAPDAAVSYGEQLLSDIRTIFNHHDNDWMASERLVMELNKIEESPWMNWNNRGLNVSSLACLLRPYKIVPIQSRIGGDRSRRYERHQFDDAFDRYLPPDNQIGSCAVVPPNDELADIPY